MASRRIEDYALLGDTQAAALVCSDGSVDWMCLPRFDSGACFAALLGEPKHGRWRICPTSEVRAMRRRYRPDTLILETEFTTEDGVLRLTDCMPPRDERPNLVRQVECVRGKVRTRFELTCRFDYGSVVPWVRNYNSGLHLIGGPDSLVLHSDVPVTHSDGDVYSEFELKAGERKSFALSWHPSHEKVPDRVDVGRAIADTQAWWREWVSLCTYQGPWREEVKRSLITLKALTFEPTGGIVAAPTTSLPEALGGVRNWDYRFCWVRDATLTLYSLMLAGYREEATAWRDWLLRAVAGAPSQLQVIYGCAGERRIPEFELPWLSGYEGSKPVRIGNAAVEQLQLDVYGELMDVLHQAREVQIPSEPEAWDLQRSLLGFLEGHWDRPDNGIWEVRGPPRHFTHSKMMVWVAFDRGIQAAEAAHWDGPVEKWKQLRDQVHAQICSLGYDARRNTFTQYYGSDALDASLLLLPQVGFLPPEDPRVIGTVRAIERELQTQDGFVLRYPRKLSHVDGLPPGEGAFLACTFWLADCYALLGERRRAEETFERLLSLRNDLGLLSEEYDPFERRLLGNFPQAFSHVALINTAFNLSNDSDSPVQRRHCSRHTVPLVSTTRRR
jgi:GH15 family glucan-1,4-alpha-glucosidase